MRRLASRKKSTMGWFYGLKLHLVSDLKGNILMIKFTTGRVDDRVALDKFLELLSNSLIIADAGYVSKKLEKKAVKNNNILLTVVRNNMKKMTTHLHHCLLNLRPRVETIFSILKEKLGLVSSLPRSEMGYLAHYIHCIFGYMVCKAFRN
jgi:IS5 family transposase